MLKISILTAFPSLYNEFVATSLVKLGQQRGLVEFSFFKFSDFCVPKEPIDEPTVGPGPGMIIKPEVVDRALTGIFEQRGHGYVIFFSPQGAPLSQDLLKKVAGAIGVNADSRHVVSPLPDHNPHIVLVCARYEGIDARVERHFADLLISVGDYVLMGGDLPAQLFLEGFLRLVPGIVGNQSSVDADSFAAALLDHDEFGLPVEWREERIPDVLRSGDHAKIAAWRFENSLQKTLLRRFDWFKQKADSKVLSAKAMLAIPRHYVVLMHGDVLVRSGEAGTTSVTSIDLHDIARTCKTYGIEDFFAVTPLKDQQEIVKTFLEFWRSDQGKKFNHTRTESTSLLQLASTFEEVLSAIEAKEGVKPLIVTTSAREVEGLVLIDFYDQGAVWAQKRPVLFVFGTGQGLAPRIMDASDYLLPPVKGMTEYNHLSVRSAVAIILDRWMGLNPRVSKLDTPLF